MGILDDETALDSLKPQKEIFTHRRVGWVSLVDGAQQLGDKIEE